jgi:hypothetical protein
VVSKCSLFTLVITRRAHTRTSTIAVVAAPNGFKESCPTGGRFGRQPHTRSWERAEIKARAMEDAADPNRPAVKVTITINDAIQSFRDDERSRHLNKHSLKKSEFFFEKQLKDWSEEQGFVFLDQLTAAELTRFRAHWGNGPATTRRKHVRIYWRNS